MRNEESGVRLESILAGAELTDAFRRGAGPSGSDTCFAFACEGRRFRLDFHRNGFDLFATEDQLSIDPSGALAMEPSTTGVLSGHFPLRAGLFPLEEMEPGEEAFAVILPALLELVAPPPPLDSIRFATLTLRMVVWSTARNLRFRSGLDLAFRAVAGTPFSRPYDRAPRDSDGGPFAA